jgi:hypothetical protein
MQRGPLSFFIDTLSFMVPNLEYFNLGQKVTYGIPVAFSFVLTGLAYSLIVSAFSILLAGIFLHGKEV